MTRKVGPSTVLGCALILILGSLNPGICAEKTLSEKHVKFYRPGGVVDAFSLLELSAHRGKVLKQVTLKYNMIRSRMGVEWIVNGEVVKENLLARGLRRTESLSPGTAVPGSLQIRFTGETGQVQALEIAALLEGGPPAALQYKAPETHSGDLSRKEETPTTASRQLEFKNSGLQVFEHGCDVLILCPDALKAGGYPFKIKQLKEKQYGYRVDLKYLESDVYPAASGKDEAAKIKRFIFDHVQSRGTRFVILLGDSDLFPVRYVAYPTSPQKPHRILSNVYARIRCMSERAAGNGDDDVGAHFNWARKQSNERLEKKLTARIADVFNSNILGNDPRAYRELYHRIAAFCSSFGFQATGTETNERTDRQGYIQAAQQWVQTVFAGIGAGRTFDDVWLYTADSVWLAQEIAGPRNDSSFSADPFIHRKWAENHNVMELAAEFRRKAEELLSGPGWVANGARITHRLRWHGWLLGSGMEDENSLDDHVRWAQRIGKESFIQAMKQRIHRAYTHLTAFRYWIPTDLYYACIRKADGGFDSWDENGNGVCGEISPLIRYMPGSSQDRVEGKNIDGCDFTPDVCVGRIPCGPGELAHYYEKLEQYARSPDRPGIAHVIHCIHRGSSENDKFIQCGDFYPTDPARAFRNIRFVWSVVPPKARQWNDEIAYLYEHMQRQQAGTYFISTHGTPQSMTGIVTTRDSMGVSAQQPVWQAGENGLELVRGGWRVNLMNRRNLPFLWANSCLVGRFTPIVYDAHIAGCDDHSNRYRTVTGTLFQADDNSMPHPDFSRPHVLQKGCDVDSLAEHLTVKAADGVIAMIGSELVTLLGDVKSLAGCFLKTLDTMLAPQRNPTYGEIFLSTQKRFVAENQLPDDFSAGTLLRHLLVFNYFGDPAIPVRMGGKLQIQGFIRQP